MDLQIRELFALQQLLNRAQGKLATKDDTGWKEILQVSQKLANFSVHCYNVYKFRSYLKIADPQPEDVGYKIPEPPKENSAKPIEKEPEKKKKTKKAAADYSKKDAAVLSQPESQQKAVECDIYPYTSEKSLETTYSVYEPSVTESSVSDPPVQSVKKKKKKAAAAITESNYDAEKAQSPENEQKEAMILIPKVVNYYEVANEVTESYAKRSSELFYQVDDLVLNILTNLNGKKRRPIKPRNKVFELTGPLSNYDGIEAELSARVMYSQLIQSNPLL